jgi:hypothetical protein
MVLANDIIKIYREPQAFYLGNEEINTVPTGQGYIAFLQHVQRNKVYGYSITYL